MKTRTIYALTAQGFNARGWQFRVYAHDAFTSRTDAVDFIPDFRKQFSDVDMDTLTVDVREMRLHERQ